jgi:AcrR family transcriptional regulator
VPKIVDRERQRAEIAAAAATWIAAHGLETLSLRNVATAYGCSKGMVQHYFADKEELLFGALLYVTDQYERRAAVAIEGRTGLDRIERRFVTILPLTAALRAEWTVRLAFYARAALVPRMQRYLREHVGRATEEGVRDLRAARRRGELRRGVDLERAYRTIMATVAGIAVAEVVSPQGIVAARQKRMLRDALAVVRALPARGKRRHV